MAFVEGVTEVDTGALPDALRQMAEYLQRLHSLRLEGASLPAREDPVAGALAYVPEADPVFAALTEIGAFTSKNAPALVHGDYWPGNVLWSEGNLAAAIDWEDAGYGDPLSDLAGCRLELLWKYGADAAETFTRHYLSRATIDCTDLSLWELYAASAAVASMSAWGLPAAREADMRCKAEGVVAAAGRSILSRK